MNLFSANIEDLRALYINSLQKALDMEQKITKALPTMVEKSTDRDLAAAFRNHLQQSQGHVSKIETLLRNATNDADTVTCKVITSLINEAEGMTRDASAPAIRDVSLIAAGQQIEHHEIAIYGTLRSWAELLGLDTDAEVLESILTEEKDADRLLSDLSDSINTTAEAPAAPRAPHRAA